MVKKISRFIFRPLKILLIFFISLTLFYFLAAILFSALPTHPQKVSCVVSQTVFISSNGIHTDIIFPVNELDPEFLSALELRPQPMFVAFGWGDKEFYINTPEWKDLTFRTGFRALFLKSEPAMHVTCLNTIYPDCKKLSLCETQISGLRVFIENSFQKNTNGTLRKIDVSGYTNSDFFYEAKGNFSLFRTCNTWVNQALKKSGIRTSVWTPFDFGIMFHLPE